jgi:hypothetical protein
VQAPAREALEMIGPSHRPEPAPPPSHSAAPSVPAQAQQQPPRTHPAHPAHPAHRAHPVHPAHPEPGHADAGHPRHPHVEIPDTAKSIPRKQQDVCALGRKYGGWREGSPETTICDQTYGR